MILMLLVNLLTVCSGIIVIKPQNQYGLEAGFVLVQGAQIDAKNYQQFGLALQSKFPGRLWVAVTEFPLSMPQPLSLGQQISSAIENIKKAGCNISKEMPFFFAGHSLGGIMMYDYILSNQTRNSLPVKVAGVILEGSYVERKNREKIMNDPTVPNILTIGGELDGLNRITRMAEAFYFDMKNPRSSNLEILTLIVKGMNHYQFAGEGQPPSLVKQNDISPEITDSEARDQLTSLLNSFMKISMLVSDDNDKTLIQNQLSYTSSLLNPLIEAFAMEGNYHMFTPCYKAKPGENCTFGSPWTQIALEIMASPNASVQTNNEFRPVQNLPPHLPFIFNNCTVPFSCTLNISTVTDNIYDTISETMDAALTPVAATEMRSKFSSRQNILLHSTGVTYDFDVTDGKVNRCAEINQYSLDWALKKSPSLQSQRYLSKGKQLVMGPDSGPYNVGPLWIWNALSYKDKIDPTTQKKFTELTSPCMKTPTTYFIQYAAAFHYCKVLSPARAMEWIYVDSLKP